jgi:protoheme IX farnesyltransferase
VLTERQDAAGVSLEGDAAARAAFRFSLLHLAGLFAALALDHWLHFAGITG